MEKTPLLERKTLTKELSNQLKVYQFHKRYQKVLEGKTGWREKALMASSRVSTNASLAWRQVVKRFVDITGSVAGLIFFAPLMILVALAVKWDSPGPVFFRQLRVGKRGKFFHIIKFRTMCQDAEAKTGPVWARKNDPRVTRVGDFLRKSHIDEIPQLFNVLFGEMSLVGPRPERPYFVDEFRKIIPNYEKRLCVKPGITGLAQVKRHYDETLADVKRKLRYDLLYVQKTCPVLDIKVLALTVLTMVLRTGR